MPTTLPIDIAAWLTVALCDATTGDPILGIPANQVNVYYKKHGALTFTSLALVDVVDQEDPQAGENYLHVGYGVYMILFSAAILDTVGTFTWVTKQSNIAVQDFQQVTSIETVSLGEDFIETIDSIQSDLTDLVTEVGTRFDTIDATLTDIQTRLTTIDTKIDALEVTVESIEGTIPSGITATFSDS